MTNSSGVVPATWLCGSNQPLWDPALSWNTENPGITPCFRKAFWTLPPFVLFWLLFPVELRRLFRSQSRDIPLTWLSIARVLAAGGLALVAIIDTCYWALDDQPAPMDLIDPILRLVLSLTVIVLLHYERKRGVQVSPFQCFFWAVFSVLSILCAYGAIWEMVNPEGGVDPAQINEALPSYTFLLSCLLIWINFGLHFFVDAPPAYRGPRAEAPQDNTCPSHTSCFPSIVTFAWFTPLAWKGFKRPLAVGDLWELAPQVASRTVVPRFNRHWDSAIAKAAVYKDQQNSKKQVPAPEEVSFKKDEDQVQVVAGTSKKPKDDPNQHVSVLPAMVKAFGLSFITGSILKLVHDFLIFVSPALLKQIIQFASSDEPMWRGILFAVLMLAAATLQSLMLSLYFYKMYLIGIWIRSAFISALYRKSLRVSQSAKKEITTGEVVNLMSVDVQRLVDIMPYINMVWSSPMQIVICLIFLWQQLGPSVLAGLAVMILMIPVQGGIAAKSRTYQMQQMKEKDQRVKMMNEILQGMKILKLYAWEPSFEKVIRGIRDNEISILKRMGYLQAGSAFIWTCAPFLVSLVSFATFVLSSPENVLDSEKAFVSLALFNILRFPLSMLPMMIAGLVQASVSLKRINKYMNCEELKEGSHSGTDAAAGDDSGSAIVVENASFTWDAEIEKPTLQNISLDVKRGSLVAVVGSVGSGKSSLVASLLGELEKTSGEVTVRGKVAYVAQQAWMQNATLKYNILFGRPLDEERYQKVLKACALESDLKMLPAGDETEIGEKGINLSGGQKQRVSLARACYSDSDVYLLDDSLSAVDAHVGKHIFDEVIGDNGLLGSKSRVLVTHGITYLPKMDDIVVLKEGVVSETGTYQELLDKKGAFAEFLVQYLNEDDDAEEADELKNLLEETVGKEELQAKLLRARSVSESQHQASESVHSSHSDLQNGDAASNSRSRKNSESPTKNVNYARQRSVVSNSGSGVTSPTKAANGVGEKKGDKTADGANKSKQYQEEKNETGNVTWAVYSYYIINMGVILFGSCISLYTVYQICSVFSSVWLSRWSDSNTEGLKNATATNTNYTENTSDRDLYLGVYGALGAGQAVAAVIGSLFLYLATLQGSLRLHHNMLSSVLRSPMSFFDTTPQGRILNRFSRDVDVLDTGMPMILRGWITCLLAVVSTFVVITYTTPIFLAPIVVILVGYYVVQRIYVATSRELKRLESVSRSPIFSHFGETVNGVQTIRAYNLQKQFIAESERKVDFNNKAAFPGIVANRWLAVRLETVGNIIIFCAALFAVLGRDTLSPGLIGLSVSYALSVTQTLNWLVRMTSEFETNVVAAERMKEYSETATEAEWRTEEEERKPQAEWPQEGRIEFKNYATRYRAGLDLVLNDISFTVAGGERTGIVGRTGAGKSSLTLALFRMIEPAAGQILIDGVDLTSIGLHDLRERLTIIPQDPVLFSGSLRLNLDPFDKYTDEQVWRALEHAHLKAFVEANLTDGLAHIVAEGGENLSVGQRQLLCLARALLRKTKVLILDEATAAVDMETDDLIQATIKEEFADCTVITIAHRLNTIVDYDKILVLDQGKIAEFDGPKALLAKKTSIFYGMCKEAGLTS